MSLVTRSRKPAKSSARSTATRRIKSLSVRNSPPACTGENMTGKNAPGNTCKPEWLDRRSRPEWFPSSSRERLTRKVLTVALAAWRRSFELGATGEVAVADQQVARQDNRRRGNDWCSILRRPAQTRPQPCLCGHFAATEPIEQPPTKANGVPRSPVFCGAFARVRWPSQAFAERTNMEPTGIEPVTSCLQSRRSPS
jgi:hypothetical protein